MVAPHGAGTAPTSGVNPLNSPRTSLLSEHLKITSRFRPDRFPKTCQVCVELIFGRLLSPCCSQSPDRATYLISEQLLSLLQKARFLTNLTVASREKETGLLTVLTIFQWTHYLILNWHLFSPILIHQSHQPTPCFLQRVQLFGKSKTYFPLTVSRQRIKAIPRHTGYPTLNR